MHYLQMVWKRKLFPIVGLLLGLVAGAIYGIATPKSYAATTQVLLSVDKAPTLAEVQAGATYLQSQIKTYGALVTAPQVLADAAKAAGEPGSDLSTAVSVATDTDTTILSISATGSTAQQASRRANAVAAATVQSIPATMPTRVGSTAQIDAHQLSQAPDPTAPSSTSPVLAALAGGFVGLLGGAGAAVLLGGLAAGRRTGSSRRLDSAVE